MEYDHGVQKMEKDKDISLIPLAEIHGSKVDNALHILGGRFFHAYYSSTSYMQVKASPECNLFRKPKPSPYCLFKECR